VVPLAPEAWNASDSIRFETYLGRPSVYINRGVALARNVSMRDGTIEYDWAVYVDDADKPVLVVPRLAGVDGTSVGIWAGNFGRGAYFSNYTVTPAPNVAARSAPPVAPPGTITNWELSQDQDAQTATPGLLPNLASLRWQKITAEPTGLVLINRHRVAPIASVPVDSVTRAVDADSVMGGRVRGTKVVFARTTIDSPGAETRRLQFSYSDGMAIYLNGRPLYFGMNPQGLRDDLGIMSPGGDAVYLPLERGHNELVVAVTEYSGGWAFWTRLGDAPRDSRAH
jgi:hypothetical protein